MSSILKALKKLETEKSLLQEEKKINVSSEILRQPAKRGINVRWLWLLGSAAIGVIIILAFALVLKSSPREEAKSREVPVPIMSPPSPALSPTLTGLDPASLTSGREKAVTSAPAPIKSLNPEPQQQVITPARESSVKLETVELPNSSLPSIEAPKTVPAAKSIPLPAALAAKPTLTLSGIAWNKDSADRLAIINGQPMATGETLNGAVVEEILPDRVKLSHDGRTIELLIGRSARTD